jgi:predicted ferric reductase
MYGDFSMYLFILIAILAKKLNYERCKVIHQRIFRLIFFIPIIMKTKGKGLM